MKPTKILIKQYPDDNFEIAASYEDEIIWGYGYIMEEAIADLLESLYLMLAVE